MGSLDVRAASAMGRQVQQTDKPAQNLVREQALSSVSNDDGERKLFLLRTKRRLQSLAIEARAADGISASPARGGLDTDGFLEEGTLPEFLISCDDEDSLTAKASFELSWAVNFWIFWSPRVFGPVGSPGPSPPFGLM